MLNSSSSYSTVHIFVYSESVYVKVWCRIKLFSQSLVNSANAKDVSRKLEINLYLQKSRLISTLLFIFKKIRQTYLPTRYMSSKT